MKNKAKKELDVLIKAGSLINSIYKNCDSELIHSALEKALDELTVAHKFYNIVLGNEE